MLEQLFHVEFGSNDGGEYVIVNDPGRTTVVLTKEAYDRVNAVAMDRKTAVALITEELRLSHEQWRKEADAWEADD